MHIIILLKIQLFFNSNLLTPTKIIQIIFKKDSTKLKTGIIMNGKISQNVCEF